jgi:hypothetical protein
MGKIVDILGQVRPEDIAALMPSQDPDDVAAWFGARFARLASPAPRNALIGRHSETVVSSVFPVKNIGVEQPLVVNVVHEFYDRPAIEVFTRRDDSEGGYPLVDHLWESLDDYQGSHADVALSPEERLPTDPLIPTEARTVVVDGVAERWPLITVPLRPWGLVSVSGNRLGRSLVAVVWPEPLQEALAVELWPRCEQ